MKNSHVYSLSTARTEKGDVDLVAHDIKANLNPTQGSSIKSILAKQSSLLNPSPAINFIYKIKDFLTDCALGMTPTAPWTGHYDATGGVIIVKEDGDIVCYHIYNRNEFQDYLLNNTKMDQASTSRYQFGDLYEENGSVFLKLNLQIRFVQ